jgi:hypothetical protein
MDLAEVVIGKVQGDGEGVHLRLLAESIRQACETTHVHTHCEILPFDLAALVAAQRTQVAA